MHKLVLNPRTNWSRCLINFIKLPPHGGGGPGMGPIVLKHLSPFLHSNPIIKTGGSRAKNINGAPWGVLILIISYGH